MINNGIFRSFILATWKLSIKPSAFKKIREINGTIYVEKKTILINKYCRSFLISIGVIIRNSKTPMVGITIGCSTTDMSL